MRGHVWRYLPTKTRDLALVFREAAKATRIDSAPVRVNQLIGGKGWSIALLRAGKGKA